MIRIEVTSEVITKAGVAKATGKPYEINEQVCYAHLVDRNGKARPYPERILIRVERDSTGTLQPLSPGEYQPTPASFYVGDFGTLSFSPRLVPIQRAQVKAG